MPYCETDHYGFTVWFMGYFLLFKKIHLSGLVSVSVDLMKLNLLVCAVTCISNLQTVSALI